MNCTVRYLNSSGIHLREIPGINAIARSFPQNWLLYASLQAYPPRDVPIEIDAMVVMDDRVLLLEIKDWNGTLTHNGDQWVLNNRPMGRSPVDIVSMKAKKIKSILSHSISGFSGYYVDSKVVLTGSATNSGLSNEEQEHVLSLDEICSISDRSQRASLLMRTRIHRKKVYEFKDDFERIARNSRAWGPLEASWDGHRVTEEDFVVHPQKVWREHRAERVRDSRFKALLRIWSFDQLPPGLNSPEHRRFIADRETKALGYLNESGSWLTRQGGVLLLIGEDKEEILTQHYELRSLPPDFTTLDRYLERTRDSLSTEDRITIVTSLLAAVAELHQQNVTHRDLGMRSIWIGSPTQIAMSGFMSCQLPEEESLGDWYAVLRGYSTQSPEEKKGTGIGNGKLRDVYLLGDLSRAILNDSENPARLSDRLETRLPADLSTLSPWLETATAEEPSSRFANAVVMADEFGFIAEEISGPLIDQSIIDKYETDQIPYVTWPLEQTLSQTSRCHVYRSTGSEGENVVVKTWPGIRRGTNAAIDLAMTQLFQLVGRLIHGTVDGLPRYLFAGLSPTGPVVVYKHEEGHPLEDAQFKSSLHVANLAKDIIDRVTKLHTLGFSHGDIAEKNILIRKKDGRIQLLDVFDLAPVGDGRARTPSHCPDNFEKLNEQQIDRFACSKIIQGFLQKLDDPQCSTAIDVLGTELERPAIETFEPIAEVIKDLIIRLEAPSRPRYMLSGMNIGEFLPQDGKYYGRSQKLENGKIQYSLTGQGNELVFEVLDNDRQIHWFRYCSFASLMHAVSRGKEFLIDIEVEDGPEFGFKELFSLLEEEISTPAARPKEEDVTSGSRVSFDVQRYWQKLIEFEEAFQPEVEIQDSLGTRGNLSAYSYERISGDFDFDDDSRVDVRFLNGRKIGEVDLEQTDNTTLVIRYMDRNLSTGDRVNIVDHRAKVSLDRRRKAIHRILDGEAAVGQLIDYLSLDRDAPTIDYGIVPSESDLEKYALNSGQKEAFKHITRYGPIGLLQGPPGTGKTRFIAAFVHWLVTEFGAKNILIASQSHESVNNAIEALVDLFKKFGGHPSLVRIGSKGITDKIRPYHTRSLREKYKTRFDGAIKRRIGFLGGSLGLRQGLIFDGIELDRSFGAATRRLMVLSTPVSANDEDQTPLNKPTLRRAISAYLETGHKVLNREVDLAIPEQELDQAFNSLIQKHPGISPADITMLRRIITLSKDWSDSLSSSHRNFEEFLAKTRSIVTATCVGVGQTKIRVDANEYDWVIVDEAARCQSGELAVPIQVGRRTLLVGDHLQLKPMIKTEIMERMEEDFPNATREELACSDFERSFKSKYGKINGKILNEQYRMSPPICDMISTVFYKPNNVQLHTSKDRKPSVFFSKDPHFPFLNPITWLDTSSEQNHIERAVEWDPNTFWNTAEVNAVLKILERISENDALISELEKDTSEHPIGVICMYKGQKLKINQAFSQRTWSSRFRQLVRIDTVDSYQGKENVIVITSLVRCNRRRNSGHVSSANRCNVALSRAKERQFIVGSWKMWSETPDFQPMRRVTDYIRQASNNVEIIKAGEI